MGSVLTSVICWRVRFYEHRDIVRVYCNKQTETLECMMKSTILNSGFDFNSDSIYLSVFNDYFESNFTYSNLVLMVEIKILSLSIVFDLIAHI